MGYKPGDLIILDNIEPLTIYADLILKQNIIYDRILNHKLPLPWTHYILFTDIFRELSNKD